MRKKMLNTTVIKSTDVNRIGTKETLSIGIDGDKNHPKKPKSPRKSLDERNTEAVSKSLVPVITSLDQLQTDVSDLKVRMTKVENRLDKQDEFNQYVRNVFERNNLK
jgi:hypothetical protein